MRVLGVSPLSDNERKPCSQCGALNYATDSVCLNCGVNLADGRVPEAPAPTQGAPSPRVGGLPQVLLLAWLTMALAWAALSLYGIQTLRPPNPRALGLFHQPKTESEVREEQARYSETLTWQYLGVIFWSLMAVVTLWLLLRPRAQARTGGARVQAAPQPAASGARADLVRFWVLLLPALLGGWVWVYASLYLGPASLGISGVRNPAGWLLYQGVRYAALLFLVPLLAWGIPFLARALLAATRSRWRRER